MTAGMADMTIWMVDWRQRPAMFELTSRSESLLDSPEKDSLTDSDSWTIEDSTASCRCLSLVMRRRSVPTRRLTQTNTGIMTSEAIVSRQSSTIIAMTE